MRGIAIKTAKYLLFLFISLYLLLWILSPVASRYFINQYLNPQKLTLGDESSIRYNPFISHLSIRDLTLTSTEDTKDVKASINNFDFQINLHQLLFNKAGIKEIVLNGATLTLEKNGDDLTVAGIAIKNENTEQVESETQTEDENTGEPITAIIEKFQFDNLTVIATVDGIAHQLHLDSLKLNDLVASAKQQSLVIDSQIKLNKVPLSLVATIAMADNLGKIDTQLTVTDLDLSEYKPYLPANIERLSGMISLNTKAKIALTKDGITVDVPTLAINSKDIGLKMDVAEVSLQSQDVTLTDLNVGHNQGQTLIALPTMKVTNNRVLASVQGIDLSLEQQTLDIANAKIDLPKDGEPLLDLSAQVALNSLRAFVGSDEQELMQLAGLKINDIKLSGQGQKTQVNVASVALSEARFSDDTSTTVPPIAAFKQLIIDQISASPESVQINEIALNGLAINAMLNKDKQLAGLILPPENKVASQPENKAVAEDKPSTDAKTTSAQAPAFKLALNKFTLTSDAIIEFADQSVDYKRNFVINTFDVGPVNNQLAEQPISLKLAGKSNKYAHFDFGGTATPFNKKPQYALSGHLKEVSLPEISTYVKDALQYEFESGQLDLALDVKVNGKKIKGNTNILLRGLELTAADDLEPKSIKDQTSIPFNVALGMLKDSKGNVELDVPLTGDTDSPSFGFSGFMALIAKQAAMSAAKDYLMTTFVPYANVVSVALTAGEYLMKIRFNDLEFAPTQAALQPEHQAFLSEFAALMKKKDKTQVTLCAISTPADIGKAPGTKVTDKAEINTLKELATSRMEAFKHHMVENEKIKSSRMLFCTPQVDSDKKAKPRITFAT